jgi:hypothetical protein
MKFSLSGKTKKRINGYLIVGFSVLFFSSNAGAIYNLAMFWRRPPTAATGMNLEVPIELTESKVYSSTSATTNENTRTSLNTADYDGTVSYSFEIFVDSSDTVSRDVTLIDTAGTTVATLTVPGYSSTAKRYRTSFVPTSLANEYRIALPATTSSFQLNVYSGRILVKQMGATKTRLYFPLIDSGQDNVNGTTYSQTNPNFYSQWKKESASLLDLVSGTPWTLEANLSDSNGSRVATAGLFNVRTGLLVTGASVSTSSTTSAIVKASFADNATNFSDLDNYELRLKSSSNTSAAYLYKAGLWVSLTNLNHAQIHHRIFKNGTSYQFSMALPEVTDLSHPSAFFESTLYMPTTTTSGETHFDVATDDYGSSFTEDTNGYVSSTAGGSKVRVRSGAVTLVQGNRYMGNPGAFPNCTGGTGCGTLDGRIIINLVK